ncbi:MAG: DUF4111 domain-containing protein [Clostridia bacterium]|nr:DUF4111 domain-containing protein [Clostridia bacterium]
MKIECLLERFVLDTKEVLRENLTGIYLHGSLVMGCFHEKKSDVDLLVVVNNPMSMEQKRAYLEKIIRLNEHAPAKGIEMSVVLKSDMMHFHHPAPFEMHFSNAHLKDYKADPEGKLLSLCGTDRDLAAHVTILRRFGKTLFGEEIPRVFSDVSRKDYLDALMYDIENAPEDILENPMYTTFSLCRILAYAAAGEVLSKKDGAMWFIQREKEEYHEIVRSAIRAYETDEDMIADSETAQAFSKYMLSKIREALFSANT